MYPRLSDLLTDAFGITFPLPIYSFGAMVATAILLAGWLLARELDRMHGAGQMPALRVKAPSAAAPRTTGNTRSSRAERPRTGNGPRPASDGTVAAMPSAIVNRLVLLAALTGVAGSKLFHILENLGDFAADPAGMIFSSGGLTFYGGLITAAFAIAWTVRRAGLPVARVADAVAPGLILGYGIGRIGCYLAGDGDWGVCSRLADKPAGLPSWLWSETFERNILGLDIPGGVCPPGFDGVYPTMLYEFALCLAAFGILWALRRHPWRAGWLFGLYLVMTGAERFAIELIRVNNVGTYLGIPATQAQVISVVLALVGLAIIAVTMRRDASAGATPTAPDAPVAAGANGGAEGG